MPLPSVQHIANVSFKDHFLAAEGAKPANGRIQVNSNTFDVTFADGRVRAKFASGNAFTNFFRSKTLARFTRTLQTQYDAWLADQAAIEQAKGEELAKTLGFADNPDADKVAGVVDEFRAIIEEANPPGKEKFLAKLRDIAALASLRNALTRVPTGAECDKIVRDAGFLTHFGDNTKKLDEKGRKGYVVNMLDTIVNGFLQVAAQMKDKKTQAVDFLRNFDGACVEAKGDNIQEWLAREAGLVKASRSDESKDLAFSITAEFSALADQVREPYLEEARKSCEAQIRAQCAEEGVTNEADIQSRIETRAQQLVMEKDDEILPKIKEHLKTYGKFALYEALAGAKRPVTEIAKDPESGKWTVTTLVDKNGAPVLKPVSGYDLDRNFDKMVDMFLEDALTMGMVDYRTRVEEPVYATREDLRAEGVLAAAEGYLPGGNADKAELTKLVRAQMRFETDLSDEELQKSVEKALAELATVKKDDPELTKTSFFNFVVNQADGSYFDERSDKARLVNLLARRTETFVDLEKASLSNLGTATFRCAQMIRNAFPDRTVYVSKLQTYLDMTFKAIVKKRFDAKDTSAVKQMAMRAYGYLMKNGILFTDNPLYSLGHRAAAGAEVNLHKLIGVLNKCIQKFAGAPLKWYMPDAR